MAGIVINSDGVTQDNTAEEEFWGECKASDAFFMNSEIADYFPVEIFAHNYKFEIAPHVYLTSPSKPCLWWRFWQWALLGWQWSDHNG